MSELSVLLPRRLQFKTLEMAFFAYVTGEISIFPLELLCCVQMCILNYLNIIFQSLGCQLSLVCFI